MSKFFDSTYERLMQIRRRQLIEKGATEVIVEVKQSIRQELPGGVNRLVEMGLTPKHAVRLFTRLAQEVGVEKVTQSKDEEKQDG